ncbi:hypothetical protein SNE40_007864 [Patella caerulea]|uniref:Uncharacterized protein n=1 Tax=Patella caerulea TaxID=87958 RepID=A0AAN8PY16_PATCE
MYHVFLKLINVVARYIMNGLMLLTGLTRWLGLRNSRLWPHITIGLAEEIAKEEKERLEKLEADRLMRMKGIIEEENS